MKKQLLLCVLLCAMTPTLTQARWLGNWLLGASLGYADREATLRTQSTDFLFNADGDLIESIPTQIQTDYTDKGFIQGIFGGYQAVCNRWLLGLELGLEWHHFDKVHPFLHVDEANLLFFEGFACYKRSGMIDISSRFGFAITEYFMPYLRLGAEFGRDVFEIDFVPTLAVLGTSSDKQKHWTHRFLVGAGAEIPLPHTCGATLRLEYDYHSKARSFVLEGSTVPLPDIIIFNTSIQPSTQSVRMSLVWNFL